MPPNPQFDISPAKRAGLLHFFYRQLFVTAPLVTAKDTNLTGNTSIVTGSNVGLGLESARQLLDLGCKVILAVRDEKKGEVARKHLLSSHGYGSSSIEVWKLDMASYDSIVQFVGRAKRELDRLDIAILNAGIFNVHEAFDATTGYEEDVQVNYLSTMLLTVLLLPVLKDKRGSNDPGRLVVVTSDTAAWAKFEERTQVMTAGNEGSAPHLIAAFKKPMSPSWDMAERYSTSKLLGLLFLSELVQRVPSSLVTVSFANPGFCKGSNLARQASGILKFVFILQTHLLGRTCSVGARSFVHAASVLGQAAHGQYIEDAKIQP